MSSPFFCTDLVEIIDTCAVFLIAARINAHNRVQTFAAAVHRQATGSSNSRMTAFWLAISMLSDSTSA